MKNVPIHIALFCLLLISCNEEANTINSKNYTEDQKIRILSESITIKSNIEWTEFTLYNVNVNRSSIPGPSNKHFRIVIKINPNDSHLWTDGKESWITSFPHSYQWLNTILTDERLRFLESLSYVTYYKNEPGLRYTLWVNSDYGIIIIEYIQE